MANWVMNVISTTSYLGIVLLMCVENVFPPIPSEFIMPLAGYMVTQGKLTLWGIIVAGVIGSILGALPLYYVGRKFGAERLKSLADSHGCWLTVTREDLETAQSWFDRHGAAAVVFCRVVPGVRSLISVPAGVAHMHLVPFLICTTIGTAVWTALLAWLGYFLGQNFKQIENYLDPITWIVFGGIAAWYIYRVMQKKGKPQAQPS